MDLEERLRAVTVAGIDGSRVLRTLLFTDLVGSTERAGEVGDRRWRDLLRRHHARVRSLLDRCEGREIDCAGDGFFATFGTASQAVDCGLRITRSLVTLDLQARVGIHTGECERFGPKVSGIAVHTAARVVALAMPSEVWVTATVKGVAEGSGLRFALRGEHALKGLAGVWPLYAAVDALGDPVRPQPRFAVLHPKHAVRH